MNDLLERRIYAVACSLSKTDGNEYTTTVTLHTRFAATEDEAKGSAVAEALKIKPGFGVTEVLCLQVTKEEPSNAG